MDQSQRPADRRYRPVRNHRQHPLFNGLMGFGVAMLGVIGFAPAANGPAFGDVTNVAPRVVAASLTFSGTDPIITGSVDAMFEALGTFVGPNSTEKQNRARIVPDAASFAAAFDEARLKIASLRASAFNDAGAPVLAEASHAPQLPAAAPRISVAALDPAAASAALTAIDTIAPGTPFPVTASQKLAYARADAPVTDFSITRDASGKQVSEKELWCLSTAIYFEARGESYRGQVGVAQVVLNRVKHKLYPSTICGVVFQNQHMRNACQFSFACDGIPERVTDAKSWKQAEEIARGAVSASLYLPEVGMSTHYHATYVYPHWAPKMKKNTKIGLHVFYQFKRGWRFG